MSGRWWTTVVLMALPGLAGAQEVVKPEVMLLLDTSRAMSLAMNGQPPVCSPNGTAEPDPGLPYVDSRFNLVRDALVGQRRVFDNAQQPWCIIQDDALRGAQQLLGRDEGFAYYRPMCCALAVGDLCTGWAPCGEDHARGLAFSDSVQTPQANYQLPNGALTRYGSDVKFSLMTADSRADADNNARGLYSYGDEVLRAPDGSLMNLGIRHDGLGNGGLIKGNRGQRFLGLIDWGVLIGEDADSVRRHNELVGWQIRRSVPVGDAPLSAMLHDAIDYVQGQAAGDADFECRRKVAVLVTQGREMVVYGGEPCPCAADAQCVNGQCVFPAGFPYDSAETYAARLRDEGVPVYVISVGPAGTPGDLRARAIAQIGSPNEGPAGGPGYFRADSMEGLGKAFDRVIRSSLRGQRSRTKPLAIASTVADYCAENQIPCARPADAVVQWRINTFSEIDGGGMYGRVQGTEMTCAADAEDNGRPGAPRPSLTPRLYEEVLAGQASPRRTISTDPLNDDALFVVTGAAMPMFNGWGGLGGLYNVAQVDAMTGIGADPQQNGADGVAALPDHEPVGQLAMGLKLNGYFGDRGLPDERGEARRQLGAMLDGDVVALRVPDLGLALPSYQAYELAQKGRMSLVAAGARDGMVHVFRAVDGREVFNIVPRAAWGRMAEAETPMDGPLDVADIVPCRTIGEGGPADCPSEPENWQFQAWLVGGVGVGGDNYFGVNMTRATSLARDVDRPLDPAQDFGNGAVWDTVSSDIINENIPPPPMGLAISRPVLTHVRVRDQIKAAVITGCGDDTFEGTAGLAMSDGAGRCVLILEATTGALIRKFSFLDNFNMSYPFTGSPVAYPADGVAPADRAYIGDRQGRLWRMDLRDAEPANWTIDVAFPLIVQGQVDVDAAGGYELGREVVDRPSLSLKADGGLVVIFGTGERSVAGGTGRSFMVSFTDRPVVDADGDVSFQVSRNWVMPLANNERATGATVVRSETAYFTTRQAVQDGGCAQAVGRLYGIHSFFRYTDADGAPDTFQASDGRRLDVLPALTQFGANGEPLGQKGLSIILPSGRVAYGLAITRTPSCVDGQAASTDLILNLADESAGGQAGIQGEAAANSSKLEVVENDAVRELPLRGRVFARGQGVEFDLCLDCKPDGTLAAGATGGSLTPFPTEVMYWGSTFLN